MKKQILAFVVASLLTMVAGAGYLWFTAKRSPGVATVEQDNRIVLVANGGRPVLLRSATCPACQKAEAWLREQGWTIDQIDVQREPARAKPYHDAIRVTSVPVLILPDRFVVGFDPGVWVLLRDPGPVPGT